MTACQAPNIFFLGRLRAWVSCRVLCATFIHRCYIFIDNEDLGIELKYFAYSKGLFSFTL